MPITLSPLTLSDIPSASTIHATTLTNDPIELASNTLISTADKTASRIHEWKLALQNPFVRLIKATDTDTNTLIGAAGFLTHEVGGLQWTSATRNAGVGSVEKGIDARLAEAREGVLMGDYDLWHLYLAFVSPSSSSIQSTSETLSQLVSWGLSQADAQDKRIYVQATAWEKSVYESLVFKTKTVVKLPVDVPEGESEDECLRFLMLRPAQN
ncbi:hypothetical protein N0V94_005653 [Neodidymelliopsis sp. IMI 364377]|nr:hypothetical protein N0V94_005653 [Neodidymelliopsis sp. IMI 364377]